MAERFAVIDTETTWKKNVMSIGVVIADSETRKMVKARYYVVEPECYEFGMFSNQLYIKGADVHLKGDRNKVIEDVEDYLEDNGVSKIFAYNASFDRSCLPELSDYGWFDIMRIAAYKQYNHMIPDYVECYGTGKMKSGYGVEQIIRMLSGDERYVETHNAYFDAIDELRIMQLLGRDISKYSVALPESIPKRTNKTENVGTAGNHIERNVKNFDRTFDRLDTGDNTTKKALSQRVGSFLSKSGLVEHVYNGGMEELSDGMILSYVVSPELAKGKLSRDDYEHFKESYEDIANRRKVYMTTSKTLLDRAFKVLHEICEDNDIELENIMDINHPFYPEVKRRWGYFNYYIVEILVKPYLRFLDKLLVHNSNCDGYEIYSYGAHVLVSLSTLILSTEEFYEDDIPNYMFRILGDIIVDEAEESYDRKFPDKDYDEYYNAIGKKYSGIFLEMVKECKSSDEIIDCISEYFLKKYAAYSNRAMKKEFSEIIENWETCPYIVDEIWEENDD